MENTLTVLDPKDLAIRIEEEKGRREMLKAFIQSQLIEGVDYGKIHLAKDCSNYKNPKKCEIESHWSKNCLFKSGGEKFCSLLQLRSEFVKDEESLSVIGEKGIFFFICRLIHNPTGNVASEGRGACSVQEKYGQVNNALKIAEKRAQIDAVLRLGLSDAFTQDLEDAATDQIETPKPQNAPQTVITVDNTAYGQTAPSDAPIEVISYCDVAGCGGVMKEKKGTRGPFLGCSNYPKCKNTRSL